MKEVCAACIRTRKTYFPLGNETRLMPGILLAIVTLRRSRQNRSVFLTSPFSMKKIMIYVLCLCLAFCLAACAAPASFTPPVTASIQPQSTDASLLIQAASAEPLNAYASKTEQKTLIAYFTWAENTHVENPDAVDVDATTSASVLLPGNTAKLAGWIQQRVGGDLFPIVVTEPYSSDYDECLDRAAVEKADNARPALVGHVENMDDYDVIFLGYPNWWYSVPMAILSFIEDYDLSGKTIVPFCAHGTGGLAGSVQDITATLPESATVLAPIGVYRPDIDSAQARIDEWLDTLGFTEQAQTDAAAGGTHQIVMTADGQSLPITLYDTPAANALYDMLPLDLTFEDYNGTEKISYLDAILPTEGEPDGCDPAIGDLCLYAPWGNLCIFYRDFHYSDGLILLGHLESGMDIVSGMEVDFPVRFEKGE